MRCSHARAESKIRADFDGRIGQERIIEWKITTKSAGWKACARIHWRDVSADNDGRGALLELHQRRRVEVTDSGQARGGVQNIQQGEEAIGVPNHRIDERNAWTRNCGVDVLIDRGVGAAGVLKRGFGFIFVRMEAIVIVVAAIVQRGEHDLITADS